VKITLELLKEIAEGHYFSVSDETVVAMARELIEWREIRSATVASKASFDAAYNDEDENGQG